MDVRRGHRLGSPDRRGWLLRANRPGGRRGGGIPTRGVRSNQEPSSGTEHGSRRSCCQHGCARPGAIRPARGRRSAHPEHSSCHRCVLKVETPHGSSWHRYNGDGYGEHEDGSPFDGTGSAGPGLCSPGNEATTSSRQAVRTPPRSFCEPGRVRQRGGLAPGTGVGRREHRGAPPVAWATGRIGDAPGLGSR